MTLASVWHSAKVFCEEPRSLKPVTRIPSVNEKELVTVVQTADKTNMILYNNIVMVIIDGNICHCTLNTGTVFGFVYMSEIHLI